MPNIFEFFKAKFRNIGRATCGRTAHSVIVKLYDNGKLVMEREIDAYETNHGRADNFYLAGRLNSFASELYGGMRKAEKERARNARRAK